MLSDGIGLRSSLGFLVLRLGIGRFLRKPSVLGDPEGIPTEFNLVSVIIGES